jgi:hypothetical protein
LGQKHSKSRDTSGKSGEPDAAGRERSGRSARGNGSWQKIEALREKAALKASLADVWDEDFDLPEEILAELDHTAEFFTTNEEEAEPLPDDEDDLDDFFDEDDEP